jgi:hypothetical protein
MSDDKDAVTAGLRKLILERTDFITETDRADASLIDLSFQSRVKPERHVWIDTKGGIDRNGYMFDLEELTGEDAWDNAVATVETTEPSVVRDVVQAWLRGSSLDNALALARDSVVERK